MTTTIVQAEQETIFEVVIVRDCRNCVYANWMNKQVYCMFFSSPQCPKGSGALYFNNAPKTKAVFTAKEKPRPAYPQPYGRSPMVQFHQKIYEMRYEDNMTFKEIAHSIGTTYNIVSQYMERCDSADLAKGHTAWHEWRTAKEKKITDSLLGLTPMGNIPPPPLSPKAKTRFEKHPLRVNHDIIFTMLREGYQKKEIAEELGLVKGSLYSYIQKCEDNWENR